MDINFKGLKIKHCFLILLIILVMKFFFQIVLESYNPLIRSIISWGLSLLVAVMFYRKFAGKYNLNFSTQYLNIIPVVILMPILLQFGLVSHIVHLIPMPETVKQALYESGSSYSWSILLIIIILAPIFEELIFRGIILKGLLKIYSPLLAIVVSSLLFGLAHLTPWSFVGAFGVGLFNGWIFWKTKNILLPISVHLTNNLFFTIFEIYFGTSYFVDKPMREIFGNPFYQILSAIICLVLLSSILYYLKQKFQKEKTKHNII